jgi:hydroxymethylpyrimidine/phosphomethylpyrimidine kinase
MPLPPVVLSMAGSDSGAGAGIQADLKTCQAFGVYCTTIITAVTAQNTLGVSAIEPMPVSILNAQWEAIFKDFNVAVIKVGMLPNAQIIDWLALALAAKPNVPVILDPVYRAGTGDALSDRTAFQILKEKVLPKVQLLTPNIPEAEILSGIAIQTPDDMLQAATILVERHQIPRILLKGGHLPDQWPAQDLLFQLNTPPIWFSAPRIMQKPMHGTGCSLSSAIAAGIALNCNWETSISIAKNYLSKAIEAAAPIANGRIPVRHAASFINL